MTIDTEGLARVDFENAERDGAAGVMPSPDMLRDVDYMRRWVKAASDRIKEQDHHLNPSPDYGVSLADAPF